MGLFLLDALATPLAPSACSLALSWALEAGRDGAHPLLDGSNMMQRYSKAPYVSGIVPETLELS